MFMTRRVLGLVAAGSLILAACGGDSQVRTRNQALPDETSVTDESVEQEPDDTIGQLEAPQEFTINSIVVLDDAEVEVQGDESTETSAPAQEFEQATSLNDDLFVIEAPEDDAPQEIISNRVTICHATGNGGYVEISVNANGLNGHDKHDGDIIPAPADGCDSIEAAATTSTTSTTTTVPSNPNERRWLDDSLGVMRVNEYYQDGVAATGPGGVMGYILTNNSILPPGLGLNFKSGRVSGMPTRAGTYSFSMYVSFWGCLCGLNKSFTVTVQEPLEPEVEDPSWTDTGLGLLIEGIGYSDGVSAFPKPSSYSVSGSLPPGLSFAASSGAITGTPTAAGTYTFTVGAAYDDLLLAPLKVTAVVTPPIAKVWVDSTIGAFVLNSPYSDAVQANGGGYLDGTMRGVMGYIIAPNSGALPGGISLDFKTGRLSGTPTQTGPFRFSIYAGFWSGSGLSLQFSGTVSEAVTTTSVAEEDKQASDDTLTNATVTEDMVTDDTAIDDTLTEDTTAEGESTATTLPAVESAAEIQGQAPTERTVTLLDVVSTDQLVAQVLPDEVTRIVCGGGCLQLLLARVGLEKGQVFARVSSTEWQLLDESTEAIEFAAGTDVANVQVKVVGEDGATYVMQGQLQREGVEDGSSMSSAIWWLLLVLLLLIAVAIMRGRRKKLATS